MADNCDRKHLGCSGDDGPVLVNRASFGINEDFTRTYTENYLVAGPAEAEGLWNNTLPILPGAVVTSITGRQDTCGEWIATVTYQTQPGQDGQCPPDEIVISGAAIQSSWTQHPCFHEKVTDAPFNGKRPSQYWGIKAFVKTPEREDPCDPDSAMKPEAEWGCEPDTTVLSRFDWRGFDDPTSPAAKVFGGSSTYNLGSFEATVTEYYAGSPPDIYAVIGYPGQPPGIPTSSGIYGLVSTGAVYEPGQGHVCGRRTLVYHLSTQPWPSINPNGCSVVGPN